MLEVKNLSKLFGAFLAVDNVSFQVKQGRCCALLGPNGAGKTTILEMIEGLQYPDQGEILYQGHPLDHRFKQKVGIQFQETSLGPYLTTRETLTLFKSFYSKSMGLDELVTRLQLNDFLDRRVNKISGGQRQRLLIALALINEPELLILDEPTLGLDPQVRRELWGILQTVKDNHTTIVLTTHYMEEASHLCDDLIILDKGKIVAQGAPEALLAQHQASKVFRLPLEAFSFPLEELTIPYFKENNSLILDADSMHNTLTYLIEKKVDIEQLSIEKQTLEDLFIKLTHLKLEGSK